jgi:adenosylcobinamide-GDP ribazoletransferase
MPAASQAVPTLRAAAAAVGFLTRVPVGRLELGAADVARGIVFFPVVGAGIGAAAGGIAALLHPSVPALAAAGIAVGGELLLTGGLHADGLADAADGLAARTRERALAIMRDPRIGAYGAAALVIALLVKAAALAALLETGDAVLAFLAAGALARTAPLPLAAALSYVQPVEGPGGVLAGRIGPVSLAVAGGLAAAVAILALRADGALMLAGAALVALGVGLVFRVRLGGVTGDVLGAAAELSGTAALVVAAALR